MIFVDFVLLVMLFLSKLYIYNHYHWPQNDSLSQDSGSKRMIIDPIFLTSYQPYFMIMSAVLVWWAILISFCRFRTWSWWMGAIYYRSGAITCIYFRAPAWTRYFQRYSQSSTSTICYDINYYFSASFWTAHLLHYHFLTTSSRPLFVSSLYFSWLPFATPSSKPSCATAVFPHHK